MIEILPTNTCPPDFGELARRSESFAKFSRLIHLDICDEEFAPVRSWPYGEGQMSDLEALLARGEMLPNSNEVTYEAHMMIREPLRVGTYLARAGCMRVLAHVETFVDEYSVRQAFSAWRAGGADEVGLAILLDTPLAALDPFLAHCDTVLMMSIPTLGKQGAPFDERIYDRISEFHKRYPRVTVAVDGGVSESNVTELIHAGARRFGIGSAISKAADPAAAYVRLTELADAAIRN